MPKLYTKDEIDTYFGGSEAISVRAKVYDEWREEWSDRKITLHHKQLHEFFSFIRDNNIARTDWTRQNAKSGKFVDVYFRHDEDYLAATLKFV